MSFEVDLKGLSWPLALLRVRKAIHDLDAHDGLVLFHDGGTVEAELLEYVVKKGFKVSTNGDFIKIETNAKSGSNRSRRTNERDTSRTRLINNSACLKCK